jgi:hypothetical protein
VFSLPCSEPFPTPGPNPWLAERIAAHASTNPAGFNIDYGGWICFGSSEGVWGQSYHPADSMVMCQALAAFHALSSYDSITAKALEFAQQYGPLGYGAFIRTADSRVQYYAEPLAYWICESLAMANAIELFQSIQSSATKKIRRSLTTTIASGSIIPEPRGLSMENKPAIEPVAGIGWKEVQALTFADGLDDKWIRFICASAQLSNDQPIVQAKIELVSLLDGKLSSNVEIRCFNLEGAVREFVPRNLLGHLYLTLSRLIKPTRRGNIRCDKCQAPIPNRKRKRILNFCNGTCRKDYNRQHR